jgi:hypothetical protein
MDNQLTRFISQLSWTEITNILLCSEEFLQYKEDHPSSTGVDFMATLSGKGKADIIGASEEFCKFAKIDNEKRTAITRITQLQEHLARVKDLIETGEWETVTNTALGVTLTKPNTKLVLNFTSPPTFIPVV